MAVRTRTKAVAAAIAAIDEKACTPIGYTVDGEARVAECRYRDRRLVVRRTRLSDPYQAALWPNGSATWVHQLETLGHQVTLTSAA